MIVRTPGFSFRRCTMPFAGVAGAALLVATSAAGAASDPRYGVAAELRAVGSSSGGGYRLQARLAGRPGASGALENGPFSNGSFSRVAKIARSPLGCAEDRIFADGFDAPFAE